MHEDEHMPQLDELGVDGFDTTDQSIDLSRSLLTVNVGKAGLLKAFGHEHVVEAHISRGLIREASPPRIEFAVDSSKMSVRPDKAISAKAQAKIQDGMHHKVLEVEAYPEIHFRSTAISESSSKSWSVTGILTLHGIAKSIALDVTRNGNAYAGTTRIRQSEYGIKSEKVAGGLVRVEDELVISFEVWLREQA